jgi:hypothetical protein
MILSKNRTRDIKDDLAFAEWEGKEASVRAQKDTQCKNDEVWAPGSIVELSGRMAMDVKKSSQLEAEARKSVMRDYIFRCMKRSLGITMGVPPCREEEMRTQRRKKFLRRGLCWRNNWR